MDNLLPCPFCGKTDTLIFSDALELEECDKFESEECPCFQKVIGYCGAHCIVCDLNKGGCGSSSGYFYSKEKAVERWNKRV